MKRTIIFILPILFLISCQQKTEQKTSETQVENSIEEVKEPKEFICTDYNFKSVQEQADSLSFYMNKAIKSDSSTLPIWEHKFFCAFPNSFSAMESLFGYVDDLGSAPLYSTENPSQKYLDNKIFSDAIGFFSELKSIPPELYYKKYTRINIYGYWQADNIQGAFGFHFKLLNDTENVCKALSKFDDNEIKSVFRFIFDGPHPKNEYNEEIYNELKPLLYKKNERLGKLWTISYDNLMSEDDGHGH